MASEEALAKKAKKVYLVCLDLMDQLGHKDCLDKMASQALTDLMAPKVIKDIPVYLQCHLKKETKETEETRGQVDLQETKEIEDIQVQLDEWECQERRAGREPKECLV